MRSCAGDKSTFRIVISRRWSRKLSLCKIVNDFPGSDKAPLRHIPNRDTLNIISYKLLNVLKNTSESGMQLVAACNAIALSGLASTSSPSTMVTLQDHS